MTKLELIVRRTLKFLLPSTCMALILVGCRNNARDWVEDESERVRVSES
jgi:hypothetical protein